MKTTKKRMSTFLMLAITAFAFTACSKDEDGDDPGAIVPAHTLVFKAETTSDLKISHLLYGYDADLTSVSGLNTITWTSPEVPVPASATKASFSVNGVGTNAASTLKVQVYVDGVLKKEEMKTGSILSVQAEYNLR